ncbi:MAG: 3-phosphoshikimate 1-carboxyvinyltransferase [Clostridia bacterium]|nr:3-phosphoshikimate 1-carboxyvinyltransferase [Clostridia bacterium]
MQVTLHSPAPRGTLPSFPSKSEAHRYLICAAFADAPTHIVCAAANDDIDATVSCLCALGADITRTADGFSVTPIKSFPDTASMDCGESGSTLRFLLPVICALGTHASLTLHGRLPARPLSPLYELLLENGACISPQGSNPLEVSGKLCGSDFSIAANVSSQFISGLLFALPLLDLDTPCTIRLIGQMESRPYLDMTLAALAIFGVKVAEQNGVLTIPAHSHFTSPSTLVVGGDWSGAAPWLCMGAVGKHPITVTGLDTASGQGDKAILSVLADMGARVDADQSTITITPCQLRGIELDAANIPDLVPVIAATAALSEGTTHITGAARLRIKESDRLMTTTAVLRALGADIQETQDGLIIHGKPTLSGGAVDAFGDHRIAMTAAVAALGCQAPVTIDGAQAVAKSYPTFWEQLSLLCTEGTVIF